MDPDAAVPDHSEPLSLPSDSMRRAGYGEAVAFRKLNERILHSVGSDWENVEEFLKRRGDRRFDRRCILSMQGATFGSIRNRYLNLAPSRGLRSWGWKDPRTSLTLAYWLVLFPKARIIHVRRDTEHVIDSLERRARAELAEASASRTGTWARILRIASDPAYRSSALRRRLGLAPYAERQASCESGWRALAETYVRECEEWRSLGECYTEVRYEEILQDPYSHALRLADYAETRPSLVTVRRAADFVIREPSQKTDR